MNYQKYKFTGEGAVDLKDFQVTKKFKKQELSKFEVDLEKSKIHLADMQSKYYADGREGLLVVFQSIDGGGKDSAIRHILSPMNQQGVYVRSFKQPSKEELSHDFLWRYSKHIPMRGHIAVFNRSYYEEVLVVKVHELFKSIHIGDDLKQESTFKRRYKHIKNFEEYLNDCGIKLVKIFLNLSKEEQKRRFLRRIDRPDKNWKFSSSDLVERGFWDDYQDAFAAAIQKTGTTNNPWWIVPADNKPFARAVIGRILCEALDGSNPSYPVMSDEQKMQLEDNRKKLLECN